MNDEDPTPTEDRMKQLQQHAEEHRRMRHERYLAETAGASAPKPMVIVGASGQGDQFQINDQT